MLHIPRLASTRAVTERSETAASVARVLEDVALPAGRSMACSVISIGLYEEWRRTGQRETLLTAAAIASDPEAFAAAEPGLLATMVDNAHAFITRLAKQGQPGPALTLLVLADNCAQAAATDDPRRPDYLWAAGELGSQCWLTDEDADALAYSVSMLRAAASLRPDDVGISASLGHALCEWTQLTHDRAARAEMLDLLSRLDMRKADSRQLASVSSAMCALGRSHDDAEVLARAIPLSERVLEMTGRQAVLLNDLGLAMSAQATLTRQPDLAARSLVYLREAIEMTAADEPQLELRRVNFAVVAREAFMLTGDVAVLSEGVDQARRGVLGGSLSLGQVHLRRLDFLVQLLMTQYERGGRSQAVIDEAVARAREALESFEPGDADRATWLFLLADALWFRYEGISARDDLMAAANMFRQAIRESEPGTHLHFHARNHLATALLAIGEEISADPDAAREAVALTEALLPDPDPGSVAPPTLVANHGSALVWLFRCNGDQAALTKGIGFLQQARAAFKEMNHPPDLAVFKPLFDLSYALVLLYRSSGDSQALREALRLGDELWKAADLDHPGRNLQPGDVRLVNTLISHSGSLVELTRDNPDITPETYQTVADLLETAVERGRTVLATTPDTFHLLPTLTAAIGAALDTLYRTTKSPDQRREAIRHLRSALDRAPSAAAAPAWAARLAMALWEGGGQTERDEAITLLDSNFPHLSTEDQGQMQANLAWMLYTRDDQRSLRRAEQIAIATVGLLHTPPKEAILLSFQAGASANSRQDWQTALRAYQAGIAALPRAAARALSRTDQEKWLKEAQGLAAQAAATALRIGDPGLALELLEAGRGVLLGQGLEDKADIARLRRKRPDLADRFEALRKEVDPPPGLVPSAMIALQHGRDQGRSTLLGEIRDIEGDDNFFRNPLASDAPELARHGPIVLLNATTDGSAALLITGSGVSSVDLPDLDAKDLSRHATAILTAYHDDATVSSILEWLWDTVAGPVLAAVRPAGPKTRIWWVPTGILGFLPIHAAGYHAHGNGASVIDWCISSYAITLRSLRHLRARPGPGKAEPRSLVIGLSDQGLHDQPTEIREVSKALGATVLDAAAASSSAVSTMLASHDWVHCAGHAQTDLSNPSRSGLIISDGIATVSDLAALDLRRGELAYLSACSTARGGTDLPDEALHVTGAFQLAGYRHVVGTLWPIHDKIAALSAVEFYKKRPAGTGASAGWAASALRQVTRQLRDTAPDRPSLWAGYVHVGP